jgi:putative FmdB family regulatory protein
MPIYSFRCEDHGQVDFVRTMSEATNSAVCACGKQMQRVFEAPLFVEDRCRFARNPRTGKDFSDMLGMPYPKDRKERDLMYKIKGIEPVTSKSEMPSAWRTAMEYNQHVQAGGDRLSPTQEKELVAEPLPKVKPIAQMMRESNVRFPD